MPASNPHPPTSHPSGSTAAAAMAEPRKPRVIRTRPETVRAQAENSGAAQADRAQPDRAQTLAAARQDSAAEPSSAVRATSSKVSVAPLPADTATPAAALAQSDVAGTVEAGATAKPAGKKKLAGMGQVFARPAKPVAQDKQDKQDKQAQPTQEPMAGQQAQVLAFPMPEHKRRRRTLLFSSLAVAAVVALAMAMALFSPALAVKTVVFEGQKLVGEQILQEAVAPLVSRPLPQVRGVEVAELLKPIIQVKSSRIEARPPSTLVVHIVERVPVALLKNGEEYLLVDQDGVQLAATKDPSSVALPLIDGGTAAIGKDTFAAMTAVLANLPQSILGQLANASAKSPDAVELKLADGRSVTWGNASDMVLKAQVLEALLNAPPPTAVPGKPAPVPAKVFDVSAPRHPVTR
ncbi:peptidase S33 [Arthrobacter glacialis]|nr:peptidase S33 [Arthrobacter glacialis]